MAWPIQTLGTLLCCLLVVTLAGQEVSQLSLAQPMIKAVCPTSEDMEMQHREEGGPQDPITCFLLTLRNSF